MAQEQRSVLEPNDEYEILPHKEIHELRDQLNRLKERPTERTLQLALAESTAKTDRLINIFEEALTMIKVEEGSLSFTEKLRPLMQKMDTILEQNSEIATGLVGIHDILADVKEQVDVLKKKQDERPVAPVSSFGGFPSAGLMSPGGPAIPGVQGVPAFAPFPPPPPPRK
ncbi:hypothetical protein HY641_00180 [Candidatus Woesearchaeota archaeon]|nr:hypothetical protein [Candidatus Woesearchaeota archaeon]